MSADADLIRDLKAAVEKNNSELRQTAEDALKQAKDAGSLSLETRDKADALLISQTALKSQLDEILERVKETDKKVESRRGHAGGDDVASMGAQVAESDALKQYVANGVRGTARIQIKQAITSASGSAGALIVPDNRGEVVAMARRRMRIRQLLAQGRTMSNMVEFAKQTTRTINARPVTEGETKPESVFVWTAAEAPVRTIAHVVPLTRQAIEDAAQLQTEIDTEMRYGLDLAEEAQLLTGAGTGQNLTGLYTAATAYSAAFTPEALQQMDTIRLAMLQLELAYYDADAIVLHPTDWTVIELLKDSQERYLFANPQGLAGPTLWGRPVVPTAAMGVDTFLVGQFDVAATIYDRMDAEVLFSSEDGDNFVKNMITCRAEKRVALAVKRPAALIKGDLGRVT